MSFLDCKRCKELEAELEKVKFEYKMKEKEAVKLLRLQHKEESMAFRERIRQETFDHQIKTMNDVIKESLKSVVSGELREQLKEITCDTNHQVRKLPSGHS